jgi:hypothetical protein
MSIGDTIKSVTKGMPVLVTGGVPGYRAGDGKLAWVRDDLSAGRSLDVTSSAFASDGEIPFLYSSDGENASPPLKWSGDSDGIASFALVVEDPDAPTPEPFVHWLLYNIPPAVHALPAHLPNDAVLRDLGNISQGKNSGMKLGWTGMAPPKGDTPHRYFFQLFALGKKLALEPGAGRSALFEAMAGNVMARGRLVGTYQR